MKFIAYSNIWIALAAGLDVISSYSLASMEFVIFPSIFIAFSTLFMYNFLRVIKTKNVLRANHSEQLHWVSLNLKWITVLLLLALSGIGFSFYFLTVTQKIIALGGGLLSLFYNFSFFNSKIALRNIPYFKTLAIALTWTVATVIMPLSINEFTFIGKIFFIKFIFYVILVIPFDIRDLIYDDKKMKTIPQIFGKNGAVFLGIIFCLTAICMSFAYFTNEKSIPLAINFGITSVILLFCIRERKELFYPFFVDGLIITQFLFLLLIQ